jgi:hypothetical protein
MAHVTEIILYPESNYLHYDDTDLKRGFFHGYYVNQEHTIALLHLYGADEIIEADSPKEAFALLKPLYEPYSLLWLPDYQDSHDQNTPT